MGAMALSKYDHSVLKQDIDGETDWFYYPSLDHAWQVLVPHYLDDVKEKYFKYVVNKKVVVSAGGHIGMFARFYSKIFERVYIFEPIPFHFFCLVNNNQSDNVIKLQCALGDENKLVGMHDPHRKNLTYEVDPNTTNAIFPTITLDTLNLDACDLLQLDVEGYELQAVRGAVETIKKYKPVIILEKPVGNVELDINQLMRELNYNMVETTTHDNIWIPL
jgi:FkbM family methyltransferase